MPTAYQRKTNRRNRSTKPADLPAKFAPGFMAKMDGRTELCRLLRERFEAIASDLGGADELSIIKTSLLERFLWLESALGKLEHAMATATDSKATTGFLAQWIQGCNSLLGIAKTLGIERQARTVDLKTYVQRSGNDA